MLATQPPLEDVEMMCWIKPDRGYRSPDAEMLVSSEDGITMWDLVREANLVKPVQYRGHKWDQLGMVAIQSVFVEDDEGDMTDEDLKEMVQRSPRPW